MRLGDWLLSPARCAVHAPTGTAVVADLHLGYGRVRRRGGDAVPVPGIAEELAPLARGLREAGVARVVVAGDLFEDGRYQRAEMEEELVQWLAEHRVEMTVVPGNHDRKLEGSRLTVVESYRVGHWAVVHGDGELPAGPFVQGHEHPCLRVGAASAACFLVGERRLVLPAYSADAAGGNVLGDWRWAGLRCVAIVEGGLLEFGDVSRGRGK